ncbi:hypothetical protein PHLGIDRAFT_233863 [Phlebiopsis gigantea 11061_1 CR5-6]|uniref:F-box domain-containing protein n=1 Tax=Phlebiopsis gigantea (strain 11061_1 CR5-6) TaxID=745531 RepID=A0A0C3S242_PHLG1|nr:hypothetical protein PHLGIDRAFT_233863 [Phlebiopsis gigantea 11061_1 CR5-6]
MPNTRPRLPQELVDAILAEVNEKDSLAECSLVCKNWVSSARRRLFESVTLRAGSLLSFDFEKNKGEDRNYEDEDPNFEDDDWDEESETDFWDEGHEPESWGFQRMLAAFIEFAIAHTFIATNIRTFRIQGQFYTETNWGYVYPVTGTTLRDIVAALPRLQTLSLSTLSVQDTSVTPVVEHSCLRTLVLGEEITGLDCDINNERQLLVIFPSLRELDFIADNFLFREHWLRPIAKKQADQLPTTSGSWRLSR